MGRPRTADPWRDTEVIDIHGARFAQGTTGVVALLGVVFGWPLAWAIMSAQILTGLVLGRAFCLPCLLYFTVVQPRKGEGPLEDSRPPRLANVIGTVVLAAAAIVWWVGAPAAATVLAGIVAALALLSAATGFCAGCEIYRVVARLRGISPRHHDRLDPADLAMDGAPRAYVEFTHPLCAECRDWERRLGGGPDPLITFDVRTRPDLARKYGVAIVPTVLAVDREGVVVERLAP
ncbi:MAG TPA: DUF4395 domain-containing protein [Solirubrobacterales bacterium]|nr:DUF4395 domain-containing protein [Solirubrobacterales bacterium]